jgi:hypothetical protein
MFAPKWRFQSHSPRHKRTGNMPARTRFSTAPNTSVHAALAGATRHPLRPPVGGLRGVVNAWKR